MVQWYPPQEIVLEIQSRAFLGDPLHFFLSCLLESPGSERGMPKKKTKNACSPILQTVRFLSYCNVAKYYTGKKSFMS